MFETYYLLKWILKSTRGLCVLLAHSIAKAKGRSWYRIVSDSIGLDCAQKGKLSREELEMQVLGSMATLGTTILHNLAPESCSRSRRFSTYSSSTVRYLQHLRIILGRQTSLSRSRGQKVAPG